MFKETGKMEALASQLLLSLTTLLYFEVSLSTVKSHLHPEVEGGHEVVLAKIHSLFRGIKLSPNCLR
jgi:hypothetical protein